MCEMASAKQIIYEKYLYKLSGTEEKQKVLKPKRNHWKQKYFIVYYEKEALILSYYDKKPHDANADPKGKMSLWPAYRITKIDVDKHACEIMTQINRMCLASSDRNSIDEFVFYLQTQTSLKDNLEGMGFSVFPENTADHRRLGCMGSICGLHISPYGLSLVIQQTRSLVAQWPLRCIRTYEAGGKGNFQFEAGRHAPFGPGVYEFQTRRGQDQEMYDLLDHYVTQATSLAQMSPGGGATDVFTEIVEEYNKLKRLTIINIPGMDPTTPPTTALPPRNSGTYSHVYNLDDGDDADSEWAMSVQRKEVEVALSVNTEDKPPALPPRPLLATISRSTSNPDSSPASPEPMLPALPHKPDSKPASPEPGPPTLPPKPDSKLHGSGAIPDESKNDYEEPWLADSAPTTVDDLPPLPPRNPKRTSRPASQLHAYEDPDLNTPGKSTNNYQDIDEIIESLPPAPPPPSFVPPTPPAVKDANPKLLTNNYEEIPNRPPPPVPYEEIPDQPPPPVPFENEYSEAQPPKPINPYEDLDAIAPLIEPKEPVSGAFDEDTYYIPSDNPTIEMPDNPVVSLENEKKTEVKETVEKQADDKVQKPPVAPKPKIGPKPSLAPKPSLNKGIAEPFEGKKLNHADFHPRKMSHNKSQSMFEIQIERPVLAKKQSLPVPDDLYVVCDFDEVGPSLEPPKMESGPVLSPPKKEDSKLTSESKLEPEEAYLDMVVPLDRSRSEEGPTMRVHSSLPRPASDSAVKGNVRRIDLNTEQDVYVDMNSEEGINNKDNKDSVYMDMSRDDERGQQYGYLDMTTAKNTANSGEIVDDMYFDMSGISVQITDESEVKDETSSPETKNDSLQLPFEVMNLSDFDSRGRSKSIDCLDDSEEEEEGLSVQRFTRSVSNPALVDEKARKSRFSAFLYGTLRMKTRRKKKKESSPNPNPQSDEGNRESKFAKNKNSNRSSMGKKRKKFEKDIQVSDKSKSFVKVSGSEKGKRATYGGDLDGDVRRRNDGENDVPTYDVMSLGRRRVKHALSTPNLL